jgi:hypothetical protein
MRMPPLRLLARGALAIALAVSLAGCQLLGLAAYKIAGPPDVPAKYVPDKTKPMLVLVENYEHQSAGAAASDLLAHYLARDLQDHQIAPVVSLEELQALRDAKGAEFARMSITAIGKELGAAQVLYVQLHSSDVTPLQGGESFTGQSAATVKVVDVGDGNTLWPTEISAGYAVVAHVQVGAANAQDPQDVRRQLNLKLSEQISKLFRKWKPDDMSPASYE